MRAKDFRFSPNSVRQSGHVGSAVTCPQADIGPSIRSKSSPAPENFFASNFQNPTVPPTGGSHLPHVHPSSFAMRRTVPGGAGDANLARSRGTGRVKARCNGRCAGCSCGRDSAARLGYRARRWQAYSRTPAAACEDAVGKASCGLAEPLDEMVKLTVLIGPPRSVRKT